MTSTYLELVLGFFGFLIFSFALYFSKKGDENKFGFAVFSLVFLYMLIDALLFLFDNELGIGKTTGTYHGHKGGTFVSYSYTYKKNKHHGSALSEPGLKTEGGYYYVRISKLFPKISGMDFSKPVKDRRKINDLQFLEFVDLILKRTYVPRTTFAKFVNVDDSQLYHEKSKYFGKTITYHKNYKLVYLRQGDGLRGHEILVTFDKLNRQIDVKTFPYYCTPCSKEELLAHLSFSTRGDEFNIKYFLPENQNVIPKENEINVSKEEEWMIDEKGIFVLK